MRTSETDALAFRLSKDEGLSDSELVIQHINLKSQDEERSLKIRKNQPRPIVLLRVLHISQLRSYPPTVTVSSST